jgi:hypothetical protein
MSRSRIAPLIAIALTALLAAGAGAGARTTDAPRALAAVPAPDPAADCVEFKELNPADFVTPTRIDNEMFPLVPGTRRVYLGVSNRGGGLTEHRVTFTVTNVTKVIHGVRTIAVWDIDENEVTPGEGRRIVEEELAFFAQDAEGNVWNFGEYPEEFDSRRRFTGAPNTWLSNSDGALGGVHMPATPAVGADYLQGDAPAVDFLDCATVVEDNVVGCALELCFENGLLTYERSPLDPAGGFQTKLHAPGVGIVEIGALDDPEGETLVLHHLIKIDQDEREQATERALRLDSRGYENSETYKHSERAVAAPGCGGDWWCHPGWADWDDWQDWHHGGFPTSPLTKGGVVIQPPVKAGWRLGARWSIGR